MTDISRRATLVAGFSLLGGCLTGTETPDTASTGTPAVDVRNPGETLEYGEAFVNVGLEITVELPTIERSFSVGADGSNQETPPRAIDTTSNEPETTTESPLSENGARSVRVPEGRAIVFAPIELANRHSDREIRIAAPNFVLVTPEDSSVEVQNIGLRGGDRTVRPSDVERFADSFYRWTTHGTVIEPGETVTTVAAFDVASDRTLDGFDIAFDPYLNGVGHEYYEPRTASWTQA